MAVRLVVFDALHTLLAPRLPIPVQYAQTFAPYLGALDPDALKRAFKTALGELQAEKPAYQSGAQDWWAEVIRRTAVGAGADLERVDGALGAIVPRLMQRFSSREGYRLHADALPALLQLREVGVRTALVSNTDSRMREHPLPFFPPHSVRTRPW
ncbi:hypothetical protein AcV7_004217 [Taiwanofungus camphoratus]|nr:hypothetical protein AcV7_004217 [Antrodia cinnamomea]